MTDSSWLIVKWMMGVQTTVTHISIWPPFQQLGRLSASEEEYHSMLVGHQEGVGVWDQLGCYLQSFAKQCWLHKFLRSPGRRKGARGARGGRGAVCW